MVDVVLFGVEKEYKRDDDEDDNHDKEIEGYYCTSEEVFVCTLARYQSCFLILIQN